MKIAWIGTGIMGAPMVSALINQNYEVAIYNRTTSKAEAIQGNVKVCYSIQEVVEDADIIFSIVSLPRDVKTIYLDNGILHHAKENAICVDMTTSSPSLAIEIAKKGVSKSIHCLDAPVSGGDVGAKNHSLTIMVGGTSDAYTTVLPLLRLMGKTITHVGKSGMGQHMKLANQIAVANNLLGAIESLAYAKKVGLPLETTINVLLGGAAASWQLSVNGKLMINQDYRPGFMNVHFIKDLKLVIEESKQVNATFPMVEKILEMYTNHLEDSFQSESTISLYKDYINS